MNMLRIMGQILCAAVLTLIASGCSLQHAGKGTPAVPTATDEGWRRIQPESIAQLWIAENEDRDVFRRCCTIGDPGFVQRLFKDMVREESIKVAHYDFIGPKLVVFLDKNGGVLSGFVYWPAGKVNHIFKPCNVDKVEDRFYVNWPSSRSDSLVVADFDRRIVEYFDVWK